MYQGCHWGGGGHFTPYTRDDLTNTPPPILPWKMWQQRRLLLLHPYPNCQLPLIRQCEITCDSVGFLARGEIRLLLCYSLGSVGCYLLIVFCNPVAIIIINNLVTSIHNLVISNGLKKEGEGAYDW